MRRPGLTLDMDDKIDGFSDLSFGIGERALRVAAHDEIGEAVRAFSAELAWIVASEPAWPVLKESSSVRASIPRTSPRMIRSGLQAESVTFNKVVERHLGLESIGLAFRPQTMFGFWI